VTTERSAGVGWSEAVLALLCSAGLLVVLRADWLFVLVFSVLAAASLVLLRARPMVLRVLGCGLLGLVLFVVGIYARGPLTGFFNRTFRMPSVVAEPFVVEISESGRPRQCQDLLAAWRAGTDAGLHQVGLSVEGDQIHEWLIARGGMLTYIRDHTRDAYSARSIIVEHPVAARIVREETREKVHVELDLDNGRTAGF
jgi:hypothetical protein